MSLTAGAINVLSVGANTVKLQAAAASGGVGPYTYQWYRSTVSGFSPGGGNIVSGATSLTLTDTGLIPNTTYYYKMVSTDTGNSNAEVTSSQAVAVTNAPNPNQFAQSPIIGQIDMRFPYNTISVQIDVSQATALYAGSPVKIVDSADGVPKVVGCSADSDECLGIINYNIKDQSFYAGMMAEISMAGNVIMMVATAAIARGVEVANDVTVVGGVQTAGSGDNVIGWAFDKASASGDIVRVFLKTPSFKTAS